MSRSCCCKKVKNARFELVGNDLLINKAKLN